MRRRHRRARRGGEWELAEGTVDGATLPRHGGTAARRQFDAAVGRTEMGCAPDVMAAETAFLDALGRAATVTRRHEQLVLTGAAGPRGGRGSGDPCAPGRCSVTVGTGRLCRAAGLTTLSAMAAQMARASIALAAALLPTACAGVRSDEVTAGRSELLGAWELTELRTGGAHVPLPDGGRGTLVFEEDQLSGTAFCNGFGAGHQVTGGALVIDGLASTEMACAPELMSAETAYLAAIDAADDGLQVEAGVLVLTGDGVLLRFRPLPPVPVSDLITTRWVLETVVDGESAATPVGVAAVLQLAEGGTFTGSTGCRALSGTWSVHGDTVHFPEMEAEGLCPDELRDQDAHVITVLGDGFSVEIEGDQLIVTDPGGDGLIYRNSPT
ncbi:META domain-containing protein [Blastococcus capsensis]|uniref:META domain-containing protein n=1 Tax=Blastococcus capsensis TaxID=1564163 RepID=UPI0025422DA5|nr:META domain-containing protein [Blastococcus capsensis]MDK3256233.1 META domain-containing protein [Blastococcus capsensis]